MRQRRLPLTAAAVLAAAALALTGCGKAGRPIQPPDTQYPRVYPNPGLSPTAAKQPKEGRALPPEWDQQDMKDRFTPGGAYIDPAVQDQMNTLGRVQPGSNLPNTFTPQGNSPMQQGIGSPGQSPLPPVQPSSPGDEEQPQ